MQQRETQCEQLYRLLWDANEEWVGLPKILDLRPRISQYSARIHTLRHRDGCEIENRVEIVNGEKHTWFRLLRPKSQAQLFDASPQPTP